MSVFPRNRPRPPRNSVKSLCKGGQGGFEFRELTCGGLGHVSMEFMDLFATEIWKPLELPPDITQSGEERVPGIGYRVPRVRCLPVNDRISHRQEPGSKN